MSHNINTDILLSIEYTKFLLSSGYSMEDAVKIISKRDLGVVSDLFSIVLDKRAAGKTMSEAINEQGMVLTGNLREVFQALGSSAPIDYLNSLSAKIIEKRNESVNRLKSRTESHIGKIAFVLMLPLFYYFFVSLKDVFASVGLQVTVPPSVEAVVLGIVVVLLLILLSLERYRENA